MLFPTVCALLIKKINFIESSVHRMLRLFPL
jgi:hypothetical protein